MRLCKGIYVEPPELAFQEREEVRASFLALLDALLAQGSYVAHRHARRGAAPGRARRIAELRPRARPLRVPDAARRARRARATSSSAHGHRLRVYVPFGTHWYEYSIRRLQENPQIAGYAAADTLRRLRLRLPLTRARPG